MRRSRTTRALIIVAAASLAAACAASDPVHGSAPATPNAAAAATSCGGSHAWPPLGYDVGPVPTGVLIASTGPDSVRVWNGSSSAWRFEIAHWVDGGCVGYVAETPIRSGVIAPGHEVDADLDLGTRQDPPVGDAKIGIAVFDAACDETCIGAPVGFGWLDLPDVPTND